MRDNNGREYKDHDLSCPGCAFEDHEEFNLSELWETFRGLNKDLDVLAIENIEDGIKEFIKKVENIITRRKSRREQLLELKECAGNDLLRGKAE